MTAWFFLPVCCNHYLLLVVLFGTYTKSLVLLCLKARVDENDFLTSYLRHRLSSVNPHNSTNIGST